MSISRSRLHARPRSSRPCSKQYTRSHLETRKTPVKLFRLERVNRDRLFLNCSRSFTSAGGSDSSPNVLRVPSPTGAAPLACLPPLSPEALSPQKHLTRRAPCIDRFEFPNIPCEYPAVWASAREAELACEAVGKRLCGVHEWEGACAGSLETPDFAESRYVHKAKREKVWATSKYQTGVRGVCATETSKAKTETRRSSAGAENISEGVCRRERPSAPERSGSGGLDQEPLL